MYFIKKKSFILSVKTDPINRKRDVKDINSNNEVKILRKISKIKV